MATVINNPTPGTTPSSEGGAGVIIGIIVAILVIILAFYFIVPGMRGPAPANTPTDTGNQETNTGGTTIEVPDEIDVNVNK